MQFNDIYELLKDIYLYGDNSMYSCDNPMTLTMGWGSERSGKTWMIRIVRVKHSLNARCPDTNSEEYKIIQTYLSGGHTRGEIMTFLKEFYPYLIQRFPEIPRYEKLKAFW
jgi:hypothetical protein